jgi:drug/metabolite transporter (DMT)-like permease
MLRISAPAPLRLKADLTLLLVAVLWGSAFAAQRVAAQLGSVHFFNGARFLLAALILVPLGRRSKILPGQWPWMLAAGAVLFVSSAVQQAGLISTSAANAGFLTSLYVVLVPFVLFIGWRQKPQAMAVCAVALAGVGAFLLSTGGRFEVRSGDAMELAGAAFWALHVVILGKFASAYDAISFTMGQLLVGSGLSWLLGAFVELLPWPPPAVLIGAVLYTAAISLALGYTLQVWGQRHTPPTDAAIILSLESVFAAIAGGLFLAEKLLPVQIGGCALIILGAVLAQARSWSKIKSSIPARHASNTGGDT